MGFPVVTVGAVALPVSETACGLLPALSVMESVPLLVPTTVGPKVTLRVQLAPAATTVPQLLVWLKSPAVDMLLMVSGTEPVLVSRILCGLLNVLTC
jgi:hypothetical protein